MLVKKCQTCNGDVLYYPCESVRKKFCSRECRYRAGMTRRHGESGTRLHSMWCGMKARCNNSASLVYPYYGGRGIRVCDEWNSSYEVFRDWCLSSGYSSDLELDRIDVDKGYGPDNCRWATRTEQMRNTRKRVNAVTSRYKGVSKYGTAGKWKVQIVVNKKNINKAGFVNEEDAARAYDDLAKRYFGEFAKLNFKEER